ncbi:clasp N terminal-domain-containing protein [Limtongia smithiae]|uniref:clasp N terminal-domain-containing protein n=1 Tax=Limtongia smithiae TaxID=1125753 RepID=UPI0034D01E29
MSLADANLLRLYFEDRGNDLDDEELTHFLSYLRHEFKHQAVEPKALETYVTCLVKLSWEQDTKLSQYALACLCHLVKRIYYQDQSKLRRYANEIVPVLIEKLADGNCKVHDIARKALTDYWRAAPLDVERCLRKHGFLNDEEVVRERVLEFLCTLQEAERKLFSVRTMLFDVVATLKDASPDVRETCKTSLVELYQSASQQSVSDLLSEMQTQQIDRTVIEDILTRLNMTSLLAPPTASSPVIVASVPASDSTLACDKIESQFSTLALQKRVPLAPIATTGENTSITAPLPTTTLLTTTSTMTTSTPLPSGIELLLKSITGTLTEDMKAQYVLSAHDIEVLIEGMVPAFEGKETEVNWSARQQHVITLRALVRGNAFEEYPIAFVAGIRILADGIARVTNSLRTTLSAHACKLILDLAALCGAAAVDPFIDTFAHCLVRLSSSTKKIAAQNAHAAFSVLLAHASFSPRVASVIVVPACRDKNASTRLFAATWLRLLLLVVVAGSTGLKKELAAAGYVEQFEGAIKSGLGDANPKVREGIRPTYWDFQALWPQRAELIMNDVDAMARKALEKANPRPNSAAGAQSITTTTAVSSAALRKTIAEKRALLAKSAERGPGGGQGVGAAAAAAAAAATATAAVPCVVTGGAVTGGGAVRVVMDG